MGQKKVTVFSQRLCARKGSEWERHWYRQNTLTVPQPRFSRTVPGTDWFSRTFKALHRGFQTPRTFKHWAKFWLIFKDFQRPCKKGAFKLWLIFKDFQRHCKKGAFKLQGPSSTEPSSDLFLRTFKGLAKKGLSNSDLFLRTFKGLAKKGLSNSKDLQVLSLVLTYF